MGKKVHEGRNIKRFREMLGIKQEALALELGDRWSQERISLLETNETIEVHLLQEISTVLKIPVEAFQNFDEEQTISIISSTFSDTRKLSNCSPSFITNPLEKLFQLQEEKIALFERMQTEKDRMMARLEKLVGWK